MRLAIVSDVHGNLTAFEAVLADLRKTTPDLVLHGGDLPHGGSSPAEIVDLIRDLGWGGVAGNTDEMLWLPESLTEFAKQTPGLGALLQPIQEMAAFTRQALGEERLTWLSGLPRTLDSGAVALVHASPASTWQSPGADADDADLESTYAPLGKPVAIYGHIHLPFIREVKGMTVANSGCVSLSYDGDPRASYLLLDDSIPTIRLVEYDVESEIQAMFSRGLPHAAWIAKTLRSATPQMP